MCVQASIIEVSMVVIFLAVISKLSIICLLAIIVGDFNINLLSATSYLKKLCNSYGLKHTFTDPTCVTPNLAAVIDHVYTYNVTCCSTIVYNIHVADHFATICTMTASKSTSWLIMGKDFTNYLRKLTKMHYVLTSKRPTGTQKYLFLTSTARCLHSPNYSPTFRTNVPHCLYAVIS